MNGFLNNSTLVLFHSRYNYKEIDPFLEAVYRHQIYYTAFQLAVQLKNTYLMNT